jgi:phosphate transport system substrate-binding protein
VKKVTLVNTSMSSIRIAAVTAGILLLAASGVAQAQKLTGAGATFPNPIYSKWFSEYSAAHPGVEINYQSIGSGGGIKQVTGGLVDFGASDVPMNDEQLAGSKIKLVHIPSVLGAVVPVFNVTGVHDLKFSPDVLADLFLGKISTWNDPRIAKDNPGVNLPNETVNVIHRAEGSGTTFIFSDYLTKVSKDWANGPGRGSALNWPKGIGGKGNDGVTGLVRQLPGSIGYVELIYAMQNHVSFGEVKNPAGNWVKASIAGVTEAAANVKQIPADYRVSITNAPGANSYPISSFTWLLVPVKSADASKGKVLKDFLNWMLNSGENEVSSLYYAPLPKSLVDKEHATVDSLH